MMEVNVEKYDDSASQDNPMGELHWGSSIMELWNFKLWRMGVKR